MHSPGKNSAVTAFRAFFSDLLQEQKRKYMKYINKIRLTFFEQHRRNA